MSQSYTLEPELQSRTPRRIAARDDNPRSSGIGMGCLRLFLAPFILVGVFMMQLTNGGGDTADEINSFMAISAAAVE